MKSLKILWQEAANELAAWCCTSATRDIQTVSSRFEHEGLSFLTITLPDFGKAFDNCLDRGWVDPNDFLGFSRGKRGLPRFLGGFLDQVFDCGTGRLLEVPSIDAIFAIRQLCCMMAKVEVDCAPWRINLAMRGYLECEEEILRTDQSISAEDKESFSRLSVLLFGHVLSHMEKMVIERSFIPKHGPGATADRLSGNAKYDQVEWTQRLEWVFPFLENAFPGSSYHDDVDHVDLLEPDAERPVKVIPVPKTLKTPRIIAIEPTCMQYMQQAMLEPMVKMLESRSVPGNTTANPAFGLVGFHDQEPNRNLAREGSLEGRLATLDLSEASDRVSNLHVELLLQRWPRLAEAVQATRSLKADVLVDGDTKTVKLHKFASMGSALTFPMEAMVFTTLIFMAIEKRMRFLEEWNNWKLFTGPRAPSRQLSLQDVFNLKSQVRVYGDDIIIPVDFVRPVISQLEAFGLKVNERKSFWTGKFRESCGGDYYDGHDVTPVRVRRPIPRSRADVSEVISIVSLRNQFYSAGMWQTTIWLDKQIARVLPRFPITEPDAPGLGRISVPFPYEGERMNERLHRPEVKAYRVDARAPRSDVSGVGALLKFFLKRGEDPFADPKHLERQGRPRSVSIKTAWIPPY